MVDSRMTTTFNNSASTGKDVKADNNVRAVHRNERRRNKRERVKESPITEKRNKISTAEVHRKPS